jgi:hypothetical protein
LAENKQYSVQELLDLAVRYRATHIKVGPLEIELAESAFGPTQSTPVPTAESDKDKMPSEQDFLFLSGAQLEPLDEGSH